jgi:DNA-binding beta-propeller fold protein YncE/mono/diheme cytochrome c family protein
MRDESLGVASSTVVLAQSGGRTVALVADEDAKSILAVDVDARKELSRTAVGGAPSALMLMPDGRLLALLRDKDLIVSLEAEDLSKPLATRCAMPTANDPVALALAGDEVLVSAGFGHALNVLDGATLATKKSVDLPREPRSIVVSDRRAFVSHAVGSVISVVDLERGKAEALDARGQVSGMGSVLQQREQRAALARMAKMSNTNADEMLARQQQQFDEARSSKDPRVARGAGLRPTCQGFALTRVSLGRVAAPQVIVDPGDLENNPDGYGDDNSPTEQPSVAILDEQSKKFMSASLVGANFIRESRDPRDGRPECLLPRAAAVDLKSNTLLVTCYGIDTLVAYDAASASPVHSERKRWIVGSGPSGVAVDTKGERAIVFSQFDRTLSVVPLKLAPTDDGKARPTMAERIALAPLPESERVPSDYALGRILFHAAGDTRIAQDGRACASCHPDGRDDAITWATPEGPRRSIMLAGRLEKSAPYSWNGATPDLQHHVAHTFERLGGSGLRSIEFEALERYITRMPAPRPLNADPAMVARGEALFHSKEAACGTCHTKDNANALTDNHNHDVKSRVRGDRSDTFNTPSLHLVGGAGPYFHDGRYQSLKELLRGSDGTMGHTKHLKSEADLDAMEAYLKTR